MTEGSLFILPDVQNLSFLCFTFHNAFPWIFKKPPQAYPGFLSLSLSKWQHDCLTAKVCRLNFAWMHRQGMASRAQCILWFVGGSRRVTCDVCLCNLEWPLSLWFAKTGRERKNNDIGLLNNIQSYISQQRCRGEVLSLLPSEEGKCWGPRVKKGTDCASVYVCTVLLCRFLYLCIYLCDKSCAKLNRFANT